MEENKDIACPYCDHCCYVNVCANESLARIICPSCHNAFVVYVTVQLHVSVYKKKED